MSYTIKVLETDKDLNDHLKEIVDLFMFAMEVFPKFKARDLTFSVWNYMKVENGRVTLALDQDGKAVGCMCARLTYGLFDQKPSWFQDLFLVFPGHPRAAHLLFGDFIDFGKSHAKYILTCKSERTNVKTSTLERYGFSKLEEYYRMEV